MDAMGGVPGGGPLVLFDLDGTLLDGRTNHHLAERFGVLEKAREVWAGDDRGPTSVSRPVKARAAALFEGIPERKLANAAAELAFHEAAHGTVEALRERGVTLGLVTASYAPAADRARRELMLDFAVGVELAVEDGTLTGELVPSRYDGPCGEWICKRAVLAAHADRFDATRTVAVGDGLNDVCMLKAADLAIAVEDAVDPIQRIADVRCPLGAVPDVLAEHGVLPGDTPVGSTD